MINPAEKPGLQTGERNQLFVVAESTSSHFQVLHRTFNTFHNFATTFGRHHAPMATKVDEANLIKLLFTSSEVFA